MLEALLLTAAAATALMGFAGLTLPAAAAATLSIVMLAVRRGRRLYHAYAALAYPAALLAHYHQVTWMGLLARCGIVPVLDPQAILANLAAATTLAYTATAAALAKRATQEQSNQH